MLNRQSIATTLGAISRTFHVLGRAAKRLLRLNGRAAPRRDASLPRLTEAKSPPLLTARHPLNDAHTLRGEYRTIRLSQIAGAATPSRLAYENIERLADSIEGCSDHEGFGLLAPVVVRALDGGRFELIDGSRRVRACGLIAARAGAEDCLIPALVFRVSVHDALLMRLASLDSAEPKPFELARIYDALRRAIALEGGRPSSARGLTAVGHHAKSQIADYIRIADAITDDVLKAAELVAEDGRPNPDALVDLTKRQLLEVAKLDTVAARAAAISAQLDRLCGRGQVSIGSSAGAVGSKDGTRDGATRSKSRTRSLVARSQTMTPEEARALIEREIAPAMLALVEQAHGRRDAEGYYSAFTTGHSCLVLPREVEGLTLEQLDRLDHALTMLAARTRRALEERQQVEAVFAPLAE